MSVTTHAEPKCTQVAEPTVELHIEGQTRSLGDGFSVRRLLPSVARRMVGPFIFVDHFGPLTMPAGHGLDVRPHPHINLSTVSYLFEGEILHRDSLGSEQLIRPGAVNWMTAGRGIVHSERSPAAERKSGARLHGLQLWVALPTAFEQIEPTFHHHAANTIPDVARPGAALRIVAGSAYGATAPVHVHSPLFYVDAKLDDAAELPLPDEHRQRAVYVVEGSVYASGVSYGPGNLIVFRSQVPACITARTPARVMLLGGEPLDGTRHIFWNFVSSSPDRIERAKQDWRERRFPSIPGDDSEFIPLPQ
jgi:redox-sensitive bicupin YhaK (pirin superfamily)